MAGIDMRHISIRAEKCNIGRLESDGMMNFGADTSLMTSNDGADTVRIIAILTIFFASNNYHFISWRNMAMFAKVCVRRNSQRQ